MKRFLAFLMALALLCGVAMAEDDFEAGLIADMEAVKTLAPDVEANILRYEKVFHGGAALDHVTVNPNYGTDASGDYIVLAYMVYGDRTEPKADLDNMLVTSNTIAHAIVDSCPGAVEACVFWDIPAYESSGKISYTIEGGEYRSSDAMFPSVMVN